MPGELSAPPAAGQDAPSAAESGLDGLAVLVEQMAKQLAAGIERRLREKGVAGIADEEGERAVRALASLAQSVATLRRAIRMNTSSETADDAGMSDDDLRREIAAVLARIAGAALPDADYGPEPGGA